MDITILLEYGWTLLILIGLEGILAADNAVVIAVLVKHLPRENRKKHFFTACWVHSYSGLQQSPLLACFKDFRFLNPQLFYLSVG